MDIEAWNKEDDFGLHLFSPARPLDQGFKGLEQVLDVIESLDDELRPDRLYSLTRPKKYSRQLLRKHLDEFSDDPYVGFTLDRAHPPDVSIRVNIWPGDENARFSLKLLIHPFAFLREANKAEECVGRFVVLVRALAACFPLSFGFGHSLVDFYLCRGAGEERVLVPPRITDVYWLNVYGPRMVEALGRRRVLSTPAALMEELPGGAVLWLSSPSPVGFASEEARVAQARALVHLRPELELESTLVRLRQRSLAFQPIPLRFHPDVAEILREEVAFEGLMRRREAVERLNRYQPPPVSEWLPASQVPASDVADEKAAVDTYEGLHAEQLIALFHKDVPQVMEGTLEALPQMDWRLWHYGWGRDLTEEQRPTLIAALGAWVGRYLVEFLGGRWVPRRNQEEAAVVVGDRAWLPFLRARHALENKESALDFSCTQLFREAERHARAKAH